MAYSLGKKINELRREKGMTQETLAERMGVTPQAVSKWENDLSAPDIQSLPLMAELFGVTTDELLGVRREPEVRLLPEEERAAYGQTILAAVERLQRRNNPS